MNVQCKIIKKIVIVLNKYGYSIKLISITSAQYVYGIALGVKATNRIKNKTEMRRGLKNEANRINLQTRRKPRSSGISNATNTDVLRGEWCGRFWWCSELIWIAMQRYWGIFRPNHKGIQWCIYIDTLWSYPPSKSTFFYFHAVFRKIQLNNRFAAAFRLAPSSWKTYIHHWDLPAEILTDLPAVHDEDEEELENPKHDSRVDHQELTPYLIYQETTHYRTWNNTQWIKLYTRIGWKGYCRIFIHHWLKLLPPANGVAKVMFSIMSVRQSFYTCVEGPCKVASPPQ